MVEFAYNNDYHMSLQMSPFEVFHGCKCQTHSSWGGSEDKLMLGLEMLKEMEGIVKKVRSNLKAAQDLLIEKEISGNFKLKIMFM